LAEAINCALSQWQELNAFLADPAVPIDNNVSEREIRRIVLNHKNSLVVGKPSGG
jgi:transposase